MSKRSEEFQDLLYRDVRIEPPKEGDDRTFQVSFSSELPYKRESFFADPWIEVLGHKSNEIDLSRLKNGASVHYNHSRLRPDRVGVTRDAWVKNGKGYAKIQLSNRDDIEDIWGDIRDGILKNISVGYKIHERVLVKSNDDGPDEYRITKWEPVEVSIVDIPADPLVGIDRSGATSIGVSSSNDIVTDPRVSTSSLSGENSMPGKSKTETLTEEASRLANQRVIEINALFGGRLDSPDMRALQLRCLNDHNCSIDAARTAVLDEIGKNKTPSGVGHFQPGEENYDGIRTSKFAGAMEFGDVMTDALLLRCNAKVENPSVHVEDARGLSLVDIAKACLERRGISTRGWSAMKIVVRALGTSDFPKILANTTEKLVLEGFNNPERGTHRLWTGVGIHADFKPTSAIAASETPELKLLGEDGEFTFGTLAETGDTVALATYGRILEISRQAIVNDDLGQLQTAARTFGDSGIRVETNVCYALLTANVLMSDGVALFDAAHANIGTSAPLSVASLGEARKLMRQQMGLNGESFLDPMPFALIVPTSLETAAEQLLSSIFDPAGNIQATTTPGFVRRLQLVADPRLDVDNAAQWYLAANPESFSWVKRIYLDGQVEPFIEEREGFERDVWQIKCRHDFAAKAYMYQGCVRNAGV